MADNYDDYSREQLLRLLRERDRRPNFGLVGIVMPSGDRYFPDFAVKVIGRAA